MPTLNGSSFRVAAPWDVIRPLDRPLVKEDVQTHGPVLPWITAQTTRCSMMTIRGTPRCVLPYLIPQTKGTTSRLVLAWAFFAPLIGIREVGAVLPTATVEELTGAYDPLLDVVISDVDLADMERREVYLFINAHKRSCQFEDGTLGKVLRIHPRHVAVAPADTPVHAFSPDLADFPSN